MNLFDHHFAGLDLVIRAYDLVKMYLTKEVPWFDIQGSLSYLLLVLSGRVYPPWFYQSITISMGAEYEGKNML